MGKKYDGKTYGGYYIHSTYAEQLKTGSWKHRAEVECIYCKTRFVRDVEAVRKNVGGCRQCAAKVQKQKAINYLHPLYSSWRNMLERCFNPTARSYKYYGSRGITVCDRWRMTTPTALLGSMAGFENFLADMGERPSPEHTIDRIDVHGPYSPENCRWATWEEQANNRRNTVWIEFQGERLSAAQWSRRLGVAIDLHAVAKKYGRSLESVLASFVVAVEEGKHIKPAHALGVSRQKKTKDEQLMHARRKYSEQTAAMNARRAARLHKQLALDVFDKEFFEDEQLDDLLSALDTLFDENG